GEVDVAEQEPAFESARLDAGHTRPAERIQHQLPGRVALGDERAQYRARLDGVPWNAGPGRHQHVGNAQVVERPLSFLEEEDPLTGRAVVISSAAAEAPA